MLETILSDFAYRYLKSIKIRDILVAGSQKVPLFSHIPYYIDLLALRRSQFFAPPLLQKLQFARLKKIVHHAYHTVPFWRSYLDSCKFHPNSFQRIEDLNRIPPVRKNILYKEDRKNLISQKLSQNRFEPYQTSGSTGDLLSFSLDTFSLVRRVAVFSRTLEYAGYQPGDQVIEIKSRKRAGFGYKRSWFFCDGPHHLEKNRHELYKLFDPHRFNIIDSFPSFIGYLTKLMEKDGMKFPLRAIIAVGEDLSEGERTVIQEMTGTKVYNNYGIAEIGSVAQECRAQYGLHINAEWVYLQVVDEGGQTLSPGSPGRVVVTILDNYAMPFIRYDVEDIGMIIPEACSCGSNLPRILLHGRTTELLRLPNGRIVHRFAIDRLFYRQSRRLHAYQVVQPNINSVHVKIIPRRTLASWEIEEIKEELTKYTEGLLDISIDLVDIIPPNPAGKRQSLISFIK